MSVRYSIVCLVLLCVPLSMFGQAPDTLLIKSFVGSGGSKVFGPFDVAVGGTGLLHLIYESASSDLDIAVGIDTPSGIQLYATSESEIHKFENLEVGVPGGNQFYVAVLSFKGSSKFRLALECSCIVPRAASAGEISSLEASELQINSEMARFLDQAKTLQRALKK